MVSSSQLAYASRTLSKHEKRYGITDMEALGVVWAAKHFRAYLLGHDCTVFTDHTPLKAMLKAKHQSGRLARWATVSSELNLDIRHHLGKTLMRMHFHTPQQTWEQMIWSQRLITVSCRLLQMDLLL